MSFDIFVGCFAAGESAKFPASILVSEVQPFVRTTEPECLLLQFGGETCTLYVDTAAPEIDGFSVERPCADIRLYESLLNVLRWPGVTLYMPGACPPLIGHPDTAQALPPSMVEELGPPVLLGSATEIPLRILAA